jgi:predicted ester cyclase
MENLMKNARRVLVGATVTAAVIGLAATGITVTAQGAAAQPATASPNSQSARQWANERVVEEFYADVLDAHHGDHATRYLTPNMAWHGGTVGTVAGASNVAGLMTAVVTAIPDLHATQEDIVAKGDEVVVRVVVTGTQTGAILGVPATGRAVRWDATDWYQLSNGKISNEWAAEDFTAFLYDTGTYKAPWIS